MDRSCPRCNKLTTDDRLVRCQFCGSLFNDPGKDPYPLTQQQEDRIYERLNKRLKLYVFGGFSIFALISGVFLVDSMISAYQRGTEFLNRTVLEKVNEKFRDPTIKQTVSDVASKEAKRLLAEQIQPEVDRFQRETNAQIESFRKFTVSMESRYTGDYQRLSAGLTKIESSEQKLEAGNKKVDGLIQTMSTTVDNLDRRKALTDLTAAAVGGSRPALTQLTTAAVSDKSPEMRRLALSEILKVKGFWVTGSRIEGAKLHDKDGKDLKVSELKLCEMIPEALHNNAWEVRAVLVRELGSRKVEKVPETLLQIIQSDDNLEVVKDAVVAWTSLTGYRSADVFGLPDIATWWESNRDSFQKTLSKAESCP